jgi:hypothetical protein
MILGIVNPQDFLDLLACLQKGDVVIFIIMFSLVGWFMKWPWQNMKKNIGRKLDVAQFEGSKRETHERLDRIQSDIRMVLDHQLKNHDILVKIDKANGKT